MLNHVTLEGRLGRNPDILTTQEGRKIAKFSLATSSTWKDEAGEWQKKTYWHSIVIHRESTIRWVQGILKRGDLVHVEGRLTYHYWTEDDGKQRRKAQVVVSDQYGTVSYPPNEKLKFQPPDQKTNALCEPEEALEVSNGDHPLKAIPFLSTQPILQPHKQTGETS